MILLIFLEINKLKLINNTIWFGQWLLKAVKNATEWITSFYILLKRCI